MHVPSSKVSIFHFRTSKMKIKVGIFRAHGILLNKIKIIIISTTNSQKWNKSTVHTKNYLFCIVNNFIISHPAQMI